MANNFIFILTEGDHDAAFIYKILKANGFSTYSKKIGEFPAPLDNFLQTDVKNITISEAKIEVARVRFLPNEVLHKNNNLLLLYSLGGDSVSNLRIELIKTLNALNIQDEDAYQVAPDKIISVLFFLDSDDIGILNRLKQVANELREAFNWDGPEFELVSNEIITLEDIRFGAHIFAESGTDRGMLEDVLLPLMEESNEDIFKAARNFLSVHESVRLFQDKLVYDQSQTILKKVNGHKYNAKKSLIGTVGQLQKSGKSNTVCIRDSDYLTAEKIHNNGTCLTIMNFINKVIVI